MTPHDECHTSSPTDPHLLDGVPQAALDAARDCLARALDDLEAGGDVEAVAHAVLAAALRNMVAWDPSTQVDLAKLPTNRIGLDQMLKAGMPVHFQKAMLQTQLCRDILTHPLLDVRIMEMVGEQYRSPQWRHLAENPNLPAHLQERIYLNGNTDLLYALSRNPNLASAIVQEILATGDKTTIQWVAEHHSDAEILGLLVTTWGPVVHYSIAMNKHASDDLVLRTLKANPLIGRDVANRVPLSPILQGALLENIDAWSTLAENTSLSWETALQLGTKDPSLVGNLIYWGRLPVDNWPVPLLREGAPGELRRAVEQEQGRTKESVKSFVDNWVGTYAEMVDAARITQR